MKKMLPVYLLWALGLLVSYVLSLVVYAYIPSIHGGVPNIKDTTGGYGHSLLRFADIEEVEELDVLFTGSSHTYRGFDPRIFEEEGISSFNLGSSAQTPLNTYYLLERYLGDLDVELIVFETYWAIASNPDGKESTIDLSSNMPVGVDNFAMAFESRTWEAVNSVMANLVAQTLFDDQLDASKQNDVRGNEYVGAGFVESTRSIDLEKVISELSSRTVELSDRQIGFVERIVKLVQKKGIKVLFVRTPVSEEFLGVVKEYENGVEPYQNIADEYGINFIDFNDTEHREAMGLDTVTHFYDKNHLNQPGVEVFNSYLLPFVEEELRD